MALIVVYAQTSDVDDLAARFAASDYAELVAGVTCTGGAVTVETTRDLTPAEDAAVRRFAVTALASPPPDASQLDRIEATLAEILDALADVLAGISS